MAVYKYLAKNAKGKTQSGEIEAANEEVAKFSLKKQGLWVIHLRILSVRTKAGSKLNKQKKQELNLFKKKIQLKDMVIFSRQFASMIEAGIAMLRVLTVLIDQTESEELAEYLKEIKNDVEQGIPLSESMTKFPDAFDRLYIAMVKAGEAGGVLDQVLNRLAGFLEARSKLTHKVQTAMTYPITVVIISSVVVWFMLTFILPKFSEIFAGTGGKLPAFTQALIDVSNFIRSPWVIPVIVAVWFIVQSIKQWYQTETGRYTLDNFMLKVPIFGDIIRKVAVARFTRTFGTLIQSGVPIITALEVVKESANNAVLEKVIVEVQKETEEGGEISTQLGKSEIFPPMVTQMVSIGEESGELENMLEKIADFYDTEVDNAVESLTSLMEPIFIVVLGGIVGAIVVAMYLPIFDVIKQIQ
jgi:type IV pilus assembly protein PilC